MPEIAFQVNEFRIYQVDVEGVSFGFINTSSGGYVPAKGETFEYDGSTVILQDGRKFTDITQLRNAIHAGWAILKDGTAVRTYRPKSAGIQVRATETRGNERATKMTIETEDADDRVIVTVADRTRNREATNARASRNVPLETAEARAVMAATGDADLDEIIMAIDDEMEDWAEERESEQMLVDVEARQGSTDIAVRVEEIKARAEADILELLASVDNDDEEVAPRAAVVAKPSQRKSARRLPVDAEEDRVILPLVREDTTETGTVIGNVSDQRKTVIEREEEIVMNVAPATPQGPRPQAARRLGVSGAIVVDEQREVSTIHLSSTAAPIRMDESAQVGTSGTESIRMGDGAQVGTRSKTASAKAPPVGPQGGVAVARVLSPTMQSFEANDSNTSSTAIQRAQEGKQLRIEKFESDENVVGTVGKAAKTAEETRKARTAVATGDVEEATFGDELTDVLPDAAVGPGPEVHRRPEDDPAYAAVKMLVPDFEWNKDRKVEVRVAAAMKHIENPLYIKGILAVETNHARSEIKKALALALEERATKARKGT